MAEELLSGWFAGPKAENAPWFGEWLRRIAEDYYAWRRNYFPEDGVVVDSGLRRRNEPFLDAFEDRMLELLGRLKSDVPFQSPRYAAHMVAEQTLPGIAGYFAAMLYNPNNVTADVAPVTVRLELEAGRMLARMIGYGDDAWAHLCSGGTAANIEALWVARTVRYLPLVVRDIRRAIGRPEGRDADDATLLRRSPKESLESYRRLWAEIGADPKRAELVRIAREAAAASPANVAEQGLGAMRSAFGDPVLVVPETHHYCFEKALDLLGLGRRALASVRVDADFRMRIDDLERVLDALEREGRQTLAVVAVVGATEGGSVDPVDRIAQLRAEREAAGKGSFWLHGDAAYGGYLRTVTLPVRTGLGERSTTVLVRDRLHALPIELPERDECAALEALPACDSVTLDPHKLGYIPYPAGAIAFSTTLVKPLIRQIAPYLEDGGTDPEADRRSDAIGLYVLEGSKPGASAAAVWLSHSLIPLDATGHGRLIRENIRNACELHALLERYPRLVAESDPSGPQPKTRAVCLCSPGSNIVCYAFRPAEPGASLARVNALNRAIFARFSLDPARRVSEQAFFVSRTSLAAGHYALDTVGGFLDRLGVDRADYASEGVFLLRSVLMNPWYGLAKERGRHYLSELVAELHAVADELVA